MQKVKGTSFLEKPLSLFAAFADDKKGLVFSWPCIYVNTE